MSAGNDAVFQSQIPQTMSAQSLLDGTSQQPTDQLPKFQANPIEFDLIKIQASKEEYP